MGRQIALNSAQYGIKVCLHDSFPNVINSAQDWAKEYLTGRVAKGKMTQEQAGAVLANLVFTSDLTEAAGKADLVIEAITEDRAAKEVLFRKLNGIAPKDAILATNSSFMVSSLFTGCVDHPERLANFHYFNPALVMRLIEVVQGPHTGKDTVEALMDFGKKTGKDPVWLRKEIDGFIANRILRVVKNEALYLLEEGIATAPEIDTAVEKGLNYPMGPFRLMDLTGIDLTYMASKRVLEETGVKQPGYDRIKEMYDAGRYGKKNGRGWYDYTDK
jgi:3-hydroxybutyryl-CoA dehydrogenase